MHCRRCRNAMVLETFVDLPSSCPTGVFMGWRCVACGAILDPVIAAHQFAAGTPAPPRGRAGRRGVNPAKPTDKVKIVLREGAP